LDCAHRDVAYRLRLDIELDGATHYHRERQAKDQHRNQALQERGWYIVRLSGRIIGQRNHHLALERVVDLVERHRRAVVLARSDLRVLEKVLSLPAQGSVHQAQAQEEKGAVPLPAQTEPPLKESTSARPAAEIMVPQLSAEAPVCPRCQAPLVLRRARQGPRAGEQFLGCSHYPRCRHTQAAS